MGGAGDPEVAVKGGEESEFRAMTKAELMKYAKDPFWVAVRWENWEPLKNTFVISRQIHIRILKCKVTL